jgi:intracellular sulfur oxidation DsrE/DsrF family protein
MTGAAGVVVHLAEGDPDRQHAVLVNVRNLGQALGHSVPVELVAHGPGVSLLTGETGLSEDLMAGGVATLACENTMRSRELESDDLVIGVATVDSGVAHLARRQLEGWAYLRP